MILKNLMFVHRSFIALIHTADIAVKSVFYFTQLIPRMRHNPEKFKLADIPLMLFCITIHYIVTLLRCIA